jgi:membrane protease YdiL (CAAX protease family)
MGSPESISEARSGRSSSLDVSVLLYVAAIGAAEVCVVSVNVALGVFAHALLIVALVNHYVLATHEPGDSRSSSAPERARSAALLVLPLVSLLRIVSLTMAIDVSDAYAYAAVGGPVLIGAVLAARLVDSGRLIELLRRTSVQMPIALSGLPLGFVGFLLAPPEPVEGDWLPIAFAVLSVVVFGALMEEIVFRGLVQDALVDALGSSSGIAAGSFLFAMAYAGVRPLTYALFIAAVGLAFALCVAKTDSLLGVVISHALLNVGLFVVWPSFLG